MIGINSKIVKRESEQFPACHQPENSFLLFSMTCFMLRKEGS